MEGPEYIPHDRSGPVPVNYFVPLVLSQQAEFFHFRATGRPLFFFGVNLENWVEQMNQGDSCIYKRYPSSILSQQFPNLR